MKTIKMTGVAAKGFRAVIVNMLKDLTNINTVRKQIKDISKYKHDKI